jgi:flagellar biosynthesis GTPase FlhF
MGDKKRSTRHPKKRSAAQKAVSKSLCKADKENIPPAISSPVNTPKPPRKPRDYKAEYQNLQRKYRHAVSYKKKLQAVLDTQKSKAVHSQKAENLVLQRTAQSKHREAQLKLAVEKAHSDGQLSKDTIVMLRKKNKALQQRLRRTAKSLSVSIERGKSKARFGRVTQKGIYTAQARKLARMMVDAGCARGKVGTLMERVGKIFGVSIDRTMSRRTVSRAILEGGIAAKMQVAYEIGLNQGKYTILFFCNTALT